jgi:hypothetical protein
MTALEQIDREISKFAAARSALFTLYAEHPFATAGWRVAMHSSDAAWFFRDAGADANADAKALARALGGEWVEYDRETWRTKRTGIGAFSAFIRHNRASATVERPVDLSEPELQEAGT